ncbi:MAG: SMC-Scp complex subunit ScpB [Lachnospiraceae bacterium]|nr:SMC-Scp complex subunit ScpB [Lachnospiraceae bacterium]
MQNEEVINEAVPETEAQKEAADSEEAQSEESENEEPDRKKGRDPELEAAIEAVLFATGNSVKMSRLAEVLERTEEEIREAAERMKKSYAKAGRGLILTELEDALQLGTKGEYYEYLIKLAKTPRRMTLSDTAIETLSIIAYKQPVTKAEIERIRGVSCEHAINRLLEYELIEEVGRLDAPGRPLLFGTTEQFLRSFGVRSLGELPVMSPELMQDFKEQAEAEAEEDLNVKVDV